MIAILIKIVLILNAGVALFVPWVGICVAYLMTLLTPQSIWWWAFADLRPSMYAIAPTLLGVGLCAMRGKLNLRPALSGINACVLFLWFSFTVSYFVGPYVHVINEFRFYDPQFMFSTLQKTYLAYLMAVLLIDDRKKLTIFAIGLVLTVLYMTYWANAQYFVYGKFGRLHGPTSLDGHGIYTDENNFAVLFVVGAPFIYYLGRYFSSGLLRLGTWMIIPLSWHAIFLTASRGALVGVAATLAVFVLRSEKKKVGLLVVCLFGAAFVWQAGDVMKSRSSTIATYQEEDSARSRLDAWDAALGMMARHPITGVGFASFGQAYPDFSTTTPKVAHNTFFQIGGEWGVLAALTYVLLFATAVLKLWRNGNRLRVVGDGQERLLYYLNEAILIGLCGFFVCSMFLSLQGYEILYYLVIVANAVLWCSRPGAATAPVAPVTGRSPRLQPRVGMQRAK